MNLLSTTTGVFPLEEKYGYFPNAEVSNHFSGNYGLLQRWFCGRFDEQIAKDIE